MAQCNYWNVNYITFQWFTIGLFSKYTKNVKYLKIYDLVMYGQYAPMCNVSAPCCKGTLKLTKILGSVRNLFLIHVIDAKSLSCYVPTI